MKINQVITSITFDTPEEISIVFKSLEKVYNENSDAMTTEQIAMFQQLKVALGQ